MKKKLCLMLAVVTIVFSFNLTAFGAEFDKDKFDDDIDFMKDIIYLVIDNYQYEVNQEQVINGLYDGFFSVLDEYSVYYTPEEYREMLEESAGEFVGIGVEITELNGQVVVVTPIPGSPALEAGIKPRDIIKYVDGADITGATVSQVSALIRGREGTSVKIGVIREKETLTFDIVRKPVVTSTVEGKVLENNIGYLKVTNFYDNTVELVKKELAEFDKQNVRKIVIDVRNNGGGTLQSAVDMLNLFVTEGPVVYVDYATGKEDVLESKLKEQKYEIAVLINEGSASATEIFAGAIKYKNEGIVVGTKSFGKGVVQTIYSLGNGSGMKFTTAEYFSVNKTPVHKIGITPDIIVENERIDISNYPRFSKSNKPVPGSVSLDVLSAEMILNELGYDVDEPDGIYDQKTLEQVIRFQNDNFLYPYGTIDIATQNTLYNALVNRSLENIEDLQLKAALKELNK